MSVFANDKDFEMQLRSDFLVEASELLSESEGLFLQLEKDPTNVTLIDKIFRIVHTIKGSAAVAGFKALSAFAHVFETLLGKLRTRETMASHDVIDVLLAAVDVLRRFVSLLRKDHAAVVDPGDVVSRIEAHIRGAMAVASPLYPAPQASATSDTVAATRKIRIVVADDESAILAIIENLLQGEGYQIIKADSGRGALKVLEENLDIDLFITDQRMPDMNGSEIVEELRRRGRDLPVIVVSGATNREEAIQFVRLGVFDFFEKPIREEKFTLSVANALRMREMKTTLAELSKLSIRSYMTFRKILEVVESESAVAASHPSIQRYSKFLEETGAVINKAIGNK